MKKKRKEKEKGVICKIVAATFVLAGVAFLTYKYSPKVKTFIDENLPIKKTPAVPEIKTKSFRKYEIYNKKR